jgi:hypothetical protein|nr:MAG TPA: hypothetical protein [Caudoviricetes sp.]
MVNKMNMMQISLTELLKILAGNEDALMQVMKRNYGSDGITGVHISTIDREHLMIVEPWPNEDREVRAVTHVPDGDMQIRRVDLLHVEEFTPSNGMHSVHKGRTLAAAQNLVNDHAEQVKEGAEREQRKESIIDQIQKGMTHSLGVVLSDEPFGHEPCDEMEFAKLPMNLDERDEVFQQLPEDKWACVMMLPNNPMYVSRKNGNYLVAELKDGRVITREYESPRCLDDAVAILMTTLPTSGEGE